MVLLHSEADRITMDNKYNSAKPLTERGVDTDDQREQVEESASDLGAPLVPFFGPV